MKIICQTSPRTSGQMSSSRRLWLMHLSEKESSRASTLTISFYRHPCVPGPAACCFCLFPYYYGTGFMVRSLLFFFFFPGVPVDWEHFPRFCFAPLWAQSLIFFLLWAADLAPSLQKWPQVIIARLAVFQLSLSAVAALWPDQSLLLTFP